MHTALATLLISSIAMVASPATADDRHPVEVTRGRFQTLPGDHGHDVRGGAIMFRTDAGGSTTTVVVRVRGLDPDTTYRTHIHDRPCSSTPPGGGHYQHVIGGEVDAVNEIWPTITSDHHGRGLGYAVHGHRARDDAQAIVIHHPTDNSIRIACLDLT